MYENWSRDFVTDFTDNGFDVSEEGETIKGKYNGKFVITGISRWFDDMLAKIETEHKIVKVKTFFNSITGNANFEVVVAPVPPMDGNSIEFMLDGVNHEFYIKYVSYWGSGSEKGLSVVGNRGDGDSGKIYISVVESPVRKTKKIRFGYNNRTKNVLVSMDQVSKLLELIISDKIIIGYLHRDSKYKYSDLPDDRVSQNFNLYIDAIKSLVK